MDTPNLANLLWWLTSLADFHLGAVVLLAAATLAGAALRQPVRRLAVAWAAASSLLLLAALAAIPGWSLWNMTTVELPPAPPEVALLESTPEPLPIAPLDRGPETQSFAAFAEPIGPIAALPPQTSPEASVAEPVAAFALPEIGVLPAMLALLGIGTVGVMAWLALGWRAGARLVADACLAPERCTRLLEGLCGAGPSPRLLVSARLAAPVAIGLRRATILLPTSTAQRATDAELRTLLTHELAHLRNGDLWLLALLRGLLVLLWMNPLYWLLRRRVRLDQEALADAAAAELSSREAYAEQLVGWARELAGRRPAPRLAGAAGLWEGPSQLRKRLGVLLDERFTVLRAATRRWRAACTLACTSLAVAASLVTLSPAEVKITPPEEIEELNLATFDVRVVDEDGEPVEDARITPWALRSSQGHGEWEENPDDAESIDPIDVVTDSDGTATIAYPHFRDADEKVRTLAVSLRVDHPEYAYEGAVHVDVPVAGGSHVVELKRGAPVEVNVLLDGEPAVGADLYAMASGDRLWGDGTPPRQDGAKLTLPPITAGDQKLRVVRMVDGKVTHFSPLIDMRLKAGATFTTTVELQPAAKIRGRLGDEAQRPIVDGRVKANTLAESRQGPDVSWATWAEVSADGEFTISGWPADEPIQLIALCRGYKATNGEAPAEESRVPEQDPYERPHVFRPAQYGKEIVLPMEPLVRCDVRIVDLDRKPVGGVEIVACPNVQWWNSGSQFYCDPLYRAEAMLETRDYEQAIDRNHAPEFWQEVDDEGRATLYLPEGNEDLVVVSKEYELPVYLGRRDVRVTLKKGEPVSKTLVVQPRGTEQLGDWDKLAGVVFGCSTREGRRICALPGVKQKVAEFRARLAAADDPRDPAILAEAYELIAQAFDDAADAEESAKWRRKAAAEAAKRAANKAKQSANEAKQAANEAKREAQQAKRSAEDAKQAVDRRKQEAVRTREAGASGREDASAATATFVTVTSVADRYPIAGPGEPNALTGRVRDTAGGPLTGTPVAVYRYDFQTKASRKLAEASTDTDGRFRFDAVVAEPERYAKPLTHPTALVETILVVAKAPGKATQVVANDARNLVNDGREIRFTMAEASVASGVVTNTEGQPVVGARVQVQPPGTFAPAEAEVHTALTDSAGRYRIDDLPVADFAAEQERGEAEQAKYREEQGDVIAATAFVPSPARVIVVAEGYARTQRPLDAIPGQCDVMLPIGATLTGRVVDDEGKPYVATRVQVQTDWRTVEADDASANAERFHAWATVGGDGAFRFDAVPPGDYLVRPDGTPPNDIAMPDQVIAGGHAVSIGPDAREIQVPDLRFTRGRIVTVQLVDDQTGAPMRFAKGVGGSPTFTLDEQNWCVASNGHVEVEEDGRFKMRVPNRAGTLWVHTLQKGAEWPPRDAWQPIGQLKIAADATDDEVFEYRVTKVGITPGQIIEQASRRLREGDAAGALTLIDEDLKKRPGDVQLLRVRTQPLIKLGRDDEAIAVYETLLNAKPTFLMVVQNNLADLLATTEREDLRDPERAIRLAQQAIGASPRFAAQLYDTLAKAHAAAGDFEAAVEAQEKAVKAAFAPQRAELQTRLSEYRERAGRAPVDSGAKPTAAGDGLVEGEYARTSGRMLWRVLDPDGNPMPGASVRSNLGGKDGVAAKKEIVNATQTTDERGEVVIELPELVDLARIWTRKAGHTPLFTQWWPSKEPDGYPLPEEFTLRMVAGRTAGGVVVNEAGEPIVGARVAVKRESGGEDPAESGRPQLGTWLAYGSAAAVTDDNGRWSIANVPPGDDVELSLMLSHPDYVDDGAWGETQQAEKVSTSAMLAGTARLVMRRGDELGGRVLDPDGQPVEGAIVIWGDDPYYDQGVNEVLTDADGVYKLPLLSEAQRRVTVVAEGWAPRTEVIDFATLDGPLDFPLQPGGEIRLRVQNEAGEPVSNAGVWLSQNAWRGVSVLHHQSGNSTIKQPIPRTADEDGVYVWDWAPEDAVTVRVGRKGFASRTVTVAAGDDQVVTLLPERVARGTIVDASTGAPVLGCSVFSVVDLGGQSVVERYDAKKVDGEFAMRLDRDDAPQGVRFEALGYRTKRLGPWAIDEAIPELRVELEPAAAVEARVVGVNGEPVAGACVRVATPTVSLGSPTQMREFDMAGVAVTDAAGRFRFPRPHERFALVVATDEGFASSEHAADGQPSELRLRPWGRVEGQILEDGQLVAEQQVNASWIVPGDSVIDTPYLGTATTDRVGRFVFDRVMPGAISVTASVGPWRDTPLSAGPSQPISVEPGQTTTLVWGDAPGGVRGRVVLRGAAFDELDLSKSLNYFIPRTPGAESGVAEDWRAKAHHSVKLTADGDFYVPGVTPGDYVLRLKLYAPPENGCLVDAIAEQDVPVTVVDSTVDLGEVIVNADAEVAAAVSSQATRFVSTQPAQQEDSALPARGETQQVLPAAKPLTVECVDNAGDPVAGVEVVAELQFLIRPGHVGRKPLRTGVSDTRGRCVLADLPFPAEMTRHEQWGSRIAITVSKQGYATRSYDAIAVRESGGSLRAVMDPPARLTVRVVDTEGEPVAGARVLSTNRGARNADALTDERGVCVIDDLKPRDDLAEHRRLMGDLDRNDPEYMERYNSPEVLALDRRITVRHPDFAPESARIEAVPGEMTIKLRRGVRLSGRVFEANGKPTERSFVEAQSQRLIPRLERDEDAFGMSRGASPSQFTDPQGRYDFGKLSEGDYLVRVRPNSRLDVGVPMEIHPPGQLVRLRAEKGDQEVDLRYEPGRMVRLRLVERDSGEVLEIDRKLVAQTRFYPDSRNDDFMGHGFQRVPVAGSAVAVRIPNEPGWLDIVVFEDPSADPQDWFRELRPLNDGVRVPSVEDGSEVALDYPVGRRDDTDQQMMEQLGEMRRAGDYAQAVELQRRLVAKYPDDSNMLWGLARSLSRLDRDAEAAAAYERVIALKTRYELAQINELAWIYAASEIDDARDPERAVMLCERAIAIDSTPGVSLTDTYAAALAATGDLERAVELQRDVVARCRAESLPKYEGRLAKYEAMLAEAAP